jgi:hypothetical protein
MDILARRIEKCPERDIKEKKKLLPIADTLKTLTDKPFRRGIKDRRGVGGIRVREELRKLLTCWAIFSTGLEMPDRRFRIMSRLFPLIRQCMGDRPSCCGNKAQQHRLRMVCAR